MTDIDLGKRKKENKNAYAERDITTQQRYGVLALQTNVHVGWAYNPHTQENCHSSKPNTWIFDHVQAVRHPDSVS